MFLQEEIYSDFPSFEDMEASFRMEQPTDLDDLKPLFQEDEVTSIASSLQVVETTTKVPESSFVEKTLDESFVDTATVSPTAEPSFSKKLQDEAAPRRRIRASVRETGYDSIRTYVKTICNHELLNRNEEIILAREIQILMQWEEAREELESKLLRYNMMIYMLFQRILHDNSHTLPLPCVQS